MKGVIEALTKYGLNELEAKTYVTLVLEGPCTASTLAKMVDINRVKAYRVLKRLQDRGLVEAILERPLKFLAIPPPKALDLLIDNLKKSVSEAEAKRDFIVGELSHPRAINKFETPKFNLIIGRRPVTSFIAKIIKEAKEKICVMTTKNDLQRLSFLGLDEDLKKLAKKGVRIQILTNVDEGGIRVAKEYSRFAEVRHTEDVGISRLVIVDEKQVLNSVFLDDSMRLDTERDGCFWTDSKDYANIMGGLFREKWKDALDLDVAVEHIKLGKAVENIKLIRDVDEYLNLWFQTASLTSSELCLLAEHLKPSVVHHEIMELIRKLSMRGVKIKILTPITEENLEEIETFFPYAEVRHIDAREKFSFLLVDQEKILLRLASNFSSEGIKLKQGIWSNNKTFINVLSQVFNEFWNKAVNFEVRKEEIKRRRLLGEALEKLKDELSEKGMMMKVYGELTGLTGIHHKFTFIISHRDGLIEPTVGWAILTDNEESRLQEIIKFYAVTLDVKCGSKLLLVLGRPVNEQEHNLAKSYNIEIIEGNTQNELVTGVISKL